MLIEYENPAERDAALRRLVGFDRHLHFVLGDRRVAVQFDARQMDAERLSAVQFVRLPMAEVTRDEFLALAAHGRVAIEADHPSLAARAVIGAALAAALAEDLS
jgi:hypothetical protein